ncbi:gliding motility-associated C-terminal domain-containing protein, partial [Cellulophaga sp. F20128]|uniref:gliding motility-associated C-terminal domain-containing protein n=1 Tax=Cellulophaga sp. F20128 TaxID=2926413 RepID=UPI001FF402DB
ENTQIYVTITPYNATGDATGCSEESFTTENTTTVPNCTSLSSPLTGTTNVPIDTDLSWNMVAEATGYRLSVGTTSGGTDIINDEDVAILTSYNLVADLPLGTIIYVNITPYNDLGDASGCSEASFATVKESKNKVKYGFSPDGDGINEYWHIEGIEDNPDNIVTIYNRWGDMVFQIQGYDNASRVFRGIANKKTKIGAKVLPEGTYFFNFSISSVHNFEKLQGFLVLKR